MDADKAKALAKQHGPTVAIAAVAVVAAKLGSPAPAPPQPPSSMQLTAERVAVGDPALPQRPAPAHPRAADGVETRLVSCGGRGARVVGDGAHATDNIGTVTLGAEPKGACTVLFEKSWTKAPHCSVNGGHLAKSLLSEIVVDDIDGVMFAYRCEP